MDKSLFFECACGMPSHVIRVAQCDEPEVYVDVMLTDGSFWERLINAFKYLFRIMPRYSYGNMFDEFIINANEDNIEKVRSILEYLIEKHKDEKARQSHKGLNI